MHTLLLKFLPKCHQTVVVSSRSTRSLALPFLFQPNILDLSARQSHRWLTSNATRSLSVSVEDCEAFSVLFSAHRSRFVLGVNSFLCCTFLAFSFLKSWGSFCFFYFFFYCCTAASTFDKIKLIFDYWLRKTFITVKCACVRACTCVRVYTC